jgi:hypothetical protein
VPISPELRQALYNTPPWLELRRRLRDERAGGRCECTGQCGEHHLDTPGARCPHEHMKPAVEQRGTVILGLAHWHQSETGLMVSEDRLIIMCQGCHLRWDLDSHVAARRRTFREKAVRKYGQQDLFFSGGHTTNLH